MVFKVWPLIGSVPVTDPETGEKLKDHQRAPGGAVLDPPVRGPRNGFKTREL